MFDHEGRVTALASALRGAGLDALVVGPGADLRYLTGYDALPLERATLLMVRSDGERALIVPQLEEPRARSQGVAVPYLVWEETADPFSLASTFLGSPSSVAVGDRLWATFLLRLQALAPAATFVPASRVVGPFRLRKDKAEIEALREAARIADEVASQIASWSVLGKTEREVSHRMAEALLSAGCERVNFAIVAAGPNAASPHHEPTDRVIADGDVLVCDFGGSVDGYCSDITRTFVVGSPSEDLERVHEIVLRAQQAGVAAALDGTLCEAVDAASRDVIVRSGFGEFFIHRTGHGIGLEEHEDPYLVAGNNSVLEPGMAFSVEPGIYLPGRFGVRIEDIVVTGAERLNLASHDLIRLQR